MRWLRRWVFSPCKIADGSSKFSSTLNLGPCKIRPIEGNNFLSELVHTRFLHHTTFWTQITDAHCLLNPAFLDIPNRQCDMRNSQSMLLGTLSPFRRFANSAGKDESISRNWLAQLWIEQKQKANVRRRSRSSNKSNPLTSPNDQGWDKFVDTLSSLGLPVAKPVLRKASSAERNFSTSETVHQQPIGQYDGDHSSPRSPEVVRLAPLLSRANLVITRDIEWANVMFAFEQESRYAIMDPHYPKSPVGFIREQSNVFFRQILRSRRPFIAYITDAMGNEIFRVRRPFFLVNSSIYAEVDGKEVGVVHSRWHLWRRIYDLYLGNKQFAVVENPGFWNWTFTLKDENDNVLAQIDRDWRGLGLELFTDAGQYVIRFGDADSFPMFGPASEMQELEVARELTMPERAVSVALAISLDSDYFSRRGGWGLPILVAGE